MNIMTSDEILAKLDEYKKVFDNFEKAVPKWIFIQMQTMYGKDYNHLGNMFSNVVNSMKFSKERIDEDSSLRYAISNHIEKYKPLFQMMDDLAKEYQREEKEK
jgi:hypothetical protein